MVDLGFLIGDAGGCVWEGDDIEDEEEKKSSALEGLAEGLIKYFIQYIKVALWNFLLVYVPYIFKKIENFNFPLIFLSKQILQFIFSCFNFFDGQLCRFVGIAEEFCLA